MRSARPSSRLLITAAALVLLTAHAEEPGAYRVIVNAGAETTTIDRKFLSDVFLKKVTRWPNGELVQPVDLDSDSPMRRRFSQDVLGRSVSAVKSYWQQMIFSGRNLPPPEFDSEQAVVQYVLRHKGAIGYVSISADIGAAKVASVR